MRNLALISLCLLSILGASAQQDISSLISKAVFENMLKHRNDAACQGKGFYTYEAFIAAAKAFGGFGTTGDDATKKKEIAAFLAQTSHETTGGWATAPDGPYAWGYCFVTEGGSSGNPGDYCVVNQQYPCAAGKKYFGRGPIQISYNYNYGPAGRAIGSNLLANPELVATDPTISFKTALWFWMTPQSPKPSSHDVITGRWTPSAADSAAGRVPGYGVITNIINGGIECGKGSTPQQEDRIGFYKRYSGIMGVGTGNNLDCNNQRPFANYNYGPAGKAIGSDLLANPDLVATDATVSFKTALWFWMTPQSPKPSSHDVITDRWTPSAPDSAAGRVPGYGVITNIINGGIECGKGSTPQQDDRIGFYKRYSGIMVVDSGKNIDCNNQRPLA